MAAAWASVFRGSPLTHSARWTVDAASFARRPRSATDQRTSCRACLICEPVIAAVELRPDGSTALGFGRQVPRLDQLRGGDAIDPLVCARGFGPVQRGAGGLNVSGDSRLGYRVKGRELNVPVDCTKPERTATQLLRIA